MKPSSYFDPAVIYQTISRNPTDNNLKSCDLRQKVEMLMVLDAAARGSDLHKISLAHMEWKEDSVVVNAFWTKEAKTASWTPFQFKCTCAILSNACTFCSLREYKSRQRIVERRRNHSNELKWRPSLQTISSLSRGKAAGISIETIRSDLQCLMTSAKLDARWTPHDLRGAVASKLWNFKQVKRESSLLEDGLPSTRKQESETPRSQLGS